MYALSSKPSQRTFLSQACRTYDPHDRTVLVSLETAVTDIRCFSCGQFAATRRDGPTAEEAGQVRRWDASIIDVHADAKGSECRAAVCCWPCYWQIDPDMWILDYMWDVASPVVPFNSLPVLEDEDPASYSFPSETSS